MRSILLAAAVAGGLAMMPATAMAQQKKACPKDATAASSVLWPAGAISTGKTVSGRHPCGRSMECVGGVSARKGGGRNCRWL
jgi:hypothetical protein